MAKPNEDKISKNKFRYKAVKFNVNEISSYRETLNQMKTRRLRWKKQKGKLKIGTYTTVGLLIAFQQFLITLFNTVEGFYSLPILGPKLLHQFFKISSTKKQGKKEKERGERKKKSKLVWFSTTPKVKIRHCQNRASVFGNAVES